MFKKIKSRRCRIYHKYQFARAFFKNARPGVVMGVIAGRQQVNQYMSGEWWDKDPVATARNIHRHWGCL